MLRKQGRFTGARMLQPNPLILICIYVIGNVLGWCSILITSLFVSLFVYIGGAGYYDLGSEDAPEVLKSFLLLAPLGGVIIGGYGVTLIYYEGIRRKKPGNLIKLILLAVSAAVLTVVYPVFTKFMDRETDIARPTEQISPPDPTPAPEPVPPAIIAPIPPPGLPQEEPQSRVPTSINWQARARELYTLHKDEHVPPKVGSLVSVTLKSGSTRESTLGILDSNTVTLVIPHGGLTYKREHLDEATRCNLWADDYARRMALEQLQEERTAHGL